MVRFTDKAREFWLQQALDHGDMPKRERPKTKCYVFTQVIHEVEAEIQFLGSGEKTITTIDIPELRVSTLWI